MTFSIVLIIFVPTTSFDLERAEFKLIAAVGLRTQVTKNGNRKKGRELKAEARREEHTGSLPLTFL